MAAPATLSELEMRELAYSQRKLAVERANLKREIDSITAEFDEQLAKLQREQLRVQADVKLADVKLIVMDQELTMLKVSIQPGVPTGLRLAARASWLASATMPPSISRDPTIAASPTLPLCYCRFAGVREARARAAGQA